MHMMIDLETLGTAPRSVIRSIGACMFDPWASTWANGASPAFYCNVDKQSCLDIGLTVDPRTEAWWDLPENAEAQGQLLSNALPIKTALVNFELFWHETKAKFAWSYGANFDVVLLEEAMRALTEHAERTTPPAPEGEEREVFQIVQPWSYKNVRCVRTMVEVAGIDGKKFASGTKHNALDDARSQAAAVTAAYGKLRIRPAGNL